MQAELCRVMGEQMVLHTDVRLLQSEVENVRDQVD